MDWLTDGLAGWQVDWQMVTDGPADRQMDSLIGDLCLFMKNCCLATLSMQLTGGNWLFTCFNVMGIAHASEQDYLSPNKELLTIYSVPVCFIVIIAL